eukprot:1158907-Pelagomonas_calceolata.AAC.3
MKPRSVLLKLQSSQNMHVLRRAPAAPGEPAAPAQPAAPVQWTDNMEKMEKMVQETASGSHERKTVRPLQARPTHFLAMRVSSSRVKEVIGQVGFTSLHLNEHLPSKPVKVAYLFEPA